MLSLHVFDFDGTLFRSPQPPALWDGEWWSDPVSLLPPVVPDSPGPEYWVSSTVSDARKSCADPDTYAVLVTGRPLSSGFRYRIPEILRSAGLKFDQVFLGTGGDVVSFKSKTIRYLLRKFQDIESVSLWEDKRAHMSRYAQVAVSEGIDPSLVFQKLVVAKAVSADDLEMPDPKVVADKFLSRDKKKMKYLGVFLDSRSRATLLHEFSPIHSDIEAEHITLAFGLSPGEAQASVGKRVSVKIVGYAEDEKAQAVVVNLGDGLKTDKIPHVTISVAPGVPPSYSNTLLAKGYQSIDGPVLTGITDMGR